MTCQPFRDFEEACRRTAAAVFFDRAGKFDLLQELGTDLLFVCSRSPEALPGIDRLAADFARSTWRAGRSTWLRVGYEGAGLGHVFDYRDAWEIEYRANRPGGRDRAQFLPYSGARARPRRSAPIPRDKIEMVQMADAPLLQMDPLSWSRHWRCLRAGRPRHLSGFMRALAATRL